MGNAQHITHKFLDNDGRVHKPTAKTSWKIPSSKGLTSREVIQQLKKHPFEVEMQGEGVVVHQLPSPGQLLIEGGKIRWEHSHFLVNRHFVP